MEVRKSPIATLEEAADYLRVSLKTVQNYQRRGVLKTVHLGKRRFFRWSELEHIARKGVPPAPGESAKDVAL